MNYLNTLTVGSGGGIGLIFGILTTEQLFGAFIFGIVGALGGLTVRLLYNSISKWLDERKTKK